MKKQTDNGEELLSPADRKMLLVGRIIAGASIFGICIKILLF